MDAHCPVAAEFEAEPVTIEEDGRGGGEWPRLDCPLIYGNCNSLPPHVYASTRSTHRPKHSPQPLLLLRCTTIPPPPGRGGGGRDDSGRGLSSRVRLVERANARHELNSISIIGRALHNRQVLIPIPATTDSHHSRAAIERHGLHLHDLTASPPFLPLQCSGAIQCRTRKSPH